MSQLTPLSLEIHLAEIAREIRAARGPGGPAQPGPQPEVARWRGFVPPLAAAFRRLRRRPIA